MRYAIHYAPEALADLAKIRASDRRVIVERIGRMLSDDAFVARGHRKPLRDEDGLLWQLRVGDYRVFYGPRAEEGGIVWVVGVRRKGRKTTEETRR